MKDEQKQTEKFEHCWQAFTRQQITRGVTRREFPQWHKDRDRYYVWTIEIRSPEIQARIDQISDICKAYLLDDYQRIPHITVFVAGFLQQAVIHDDDFDDAALEAQKTILTSASPNIRLSVAGVNSFLSCPFLEIIDEENALQKIRNELFSLYEQPHRPEIRDGDYLPHITLGLYNSDYPCQQIATLLSEYRKLEPISLLVDNITLMSYDAKVIGSSLNVETIVHFT